MLDALSDKKVYSVQFFLILFKSANPSIKNQTYNRGQDCWNT